MEQIEFNIHILKRFILKIEMEQKLYQETMRILINQAKNIRDKYKHSLEIESFLQQLFKMKDVAKRNSYYEEFKQKKINDTLCYGDIFYLQENNLEDDLENGRITYGIKNYKINADFYHPSIGSEKLYQVVEALKSAGEKVISNSIQAFEKCFEPVLYYLIKTKPEAYLHNKNIAYSDIVSQNIEQLKEKIINDEIDKLMRGVSETIKKINDIHNLHLEKYQDLWDSYIEMDLHRNLIIHNDGLVNAEYIKKVPEKYKEAKQYEYLPCSKICIEEKTNNLIKFAFLLFYLIGESESELDELDLTAFDLLKNQNWDVAEYAYSLLLKTSKASHSSKVMWQINWLNAKKHKYGIEKTKNEIEKLDVTGMEKLFSVAKNLLLEDYEAIEDDLESCYPHDYNSYYIHTWPIFIEFRKTKYYQNFREKHQEDFEQYDFTPKSKDND